MASCYSAKFTPYCTTLKSEILLGFTKSILMNSRGLIIQGSSRSDGNTYKIVRFLQAETGFELIDLTDYDIGPFDYEFKNSGDDFIPLIKKIVENYDTIVFATPVYWYAMSGTMKIFFDRISDCLKTEKETGRKLRGKKMAAICCSSGEEEFEGFFVPFKLSAEYLGMKYLGDLHTWIENDKIGEQVLNKLKRFITVL